MVTWKCTHRSILREYDENRHKVTHSMGSLTFQDGV
jgi:hypothetical protein